jgi:anti-sigma factor RsiW
MNINRYNYEEYFLLYVDNELTKAERLEVETFVHNNPDLEEELIMLKQSKLKPEAFISFPGKSVLMKPEPASLINETNYEEFFLLYVDNELDASFRKDVEAFAASQPRFQQELDLLMQTKTQPEETIVFPDKSLLYKEPAEKRVVIMWWRTMAVAAMLLLALGIFWISSSDKAVSTTPAGVAKTGEPQKNNNAAQNEDPAAAEKKEQPALPADRPAVTQQTNNDQQLASQNTTKKSNDDHQPVSGDKLYADNQTKAQNQVQDQDPGTEPKIAKVDIGVESSNRNISTSLETASLASAVSIKSDPIVQTASSSFPDEGDENSIAIASVDKKSKMRGLFRKVTRVFEKTTNLPAVEEKGLLIGGFEIALK